MVANNNLSGHAHSDLFEMKQGMKRTGSGRLLVYYHPQNAEPCLLEVLSDGSERTLKTYPSTPSSVTISRMREVISDFKQATPDALSMALVLWSHGTGWLADDGSINDPDMDGTGDAGATQSPLSFGWDGVYDPKKMKLPALAKALEGNNFDYIYFDCCHMATIEVAYELRKLTPYIIASPTELGMDGMPYDKNIPLLLSYKPQLEAAMSNTFNYYPTPATNGCAITLIQTDGLQELATLCNEALSLDTPEGYTPVPYFRSSVIPTGIFDMRHYYHALTETAPELRRKWDAAYYKVVKHSLSTPTVYGLDASQFSGLGTHIISGNNTSSYLGYDETAWYNDIVAQVESAK